MAAVAVVLRVEINGLDLEFELVEARRMNFLVVVLWVLGAIFGIVKMEEVRVKVEFMAAAVVVSGGGRR